MYPEEGRTDRGDSKLKDIKLISNTDPRIEWRADISLYKGWFDMLPGQIENNQRQRAVIASITERGTIPGALTEGVQWGEYLSGNLNMVQMSDQIQRRIQELVSGAGTGGIGLLPLFKVNEDGKVDLTLIDTATGEVT